MAKRKTIEVSALRDKVNQMLEASAPEVTDGRTALAVLLESVLMETGNYSGFRFTDGNNGDTDRTRRHYYMSGHSS
jgi:hypothetical protein